MFSADYSQRHIARYMCGLWLSHNRPALALIRRMLPPGITHYLSHPAQLHQPRQSDKRVRRQRFELVLGDIQRLQTRERNDLIQRSLPVAAEVQRCEAIRQRGN